MKVTPFDVSGLVKHGKSRRQTKRTSLLPENEGIMNHAESRRQTIRHHCCKKMKVTPFDVSGVVKHGESRRQTKRISLSVWLPENEGTPI